MRILELLSEALSVSQVGVDILEEVKNKLPKSLSEWYENNIEDLPMYAYAIDDSAMPKHAPGIEQVKEFLQFFFTRIFLRKLNAVIQTGNSKVVFEPLEAENGMHYNGVITLNEKYLDDLSVIVYDRLMQSFINNGYQVLPIEWHELDSKISDDLDKMTRTFVHELTHAHQYNLTYTRVPSMGYRSYLEKNKQKFYELLNKKIYGAAYLSSPQEIGAFSQDFAFKLLTGLKGDNTTEEKIDELTFIMKELNRQNTHYSTLNKSHPVESRSIQRFLKKTYQELSIHLDKLKQIRHNELDKQAMNDLDANPPTDASGNIDWDKYEKAMTKQAIKMNRKNPANVGKNIMGLTPPKK